MRRLGSGGNFNRGLSRTGADGEGREGIKGKRYWIGYEF